MMDGYHPMTENAGSKVPRRGYDLDLFKEEKEAGLLDGFQVEPQFSGNSPVGKVSDVVKMGDLPESKEFPKPYE